MTVDDSQPLTELIRCHGAALVLYARQWCSDPDDAVQEAFVELSNQANLPNDPLAWLYIVTKRRAINQTRGAVRRRKRNAQLRSESTLNSAWFESELETQDEIAKLQVQLERLNAIEREIVVAHTWGKLSFAQIAAVVELSPSTVHRRYHGAIEKLKLAWSEAAANKNSTQTPPAQQETPAQLSTKPFAEENSGSTLLFRTTS